MKFIFKDTSRLRRDSLSQGDVIARTEAVVASIRQAHQYYADAQHYTHFIVITQSCDLVRRRGEFNAPYITIAAVKPFKSCIDDFLTSASKRMPGTDFSYHTPAALSKARQMIERHLNNTEPEHFFLPRSGNDNIPEDLLAYLRLTIALRKDHYDVLAASKIAELEDVFQAKLGWLKGNIYSRVATPDLDEVLDNGPQVKKDYYDEYISDDEIIPLSSLQAEFLRELVKRRRTEIERDLSADEVISMLELERPNDIRIIAESVVDRLVKNKIIDGADRDLVKKAISAVSNVSIIKTIINQMPNNNR